MMEKKIAVRLICVCGTKVVRVALVGVESEWEVVVGKVKIVKVKDTIAIVNSTEFYFKKCKNP